MPGNILAPGAVLVLWTLAMLIWAAVTRFQAFGKAGIDLKAAPPGGRGVDLEGVLPPLTNWKSHNYTHLLEQPTLFYAVIIFLHLSGGDVGYTRGLAWAYVVLRIIHSLWQSTVNRIPVRFIIFALSTLCLLALTLLAVIATLGN
ncbi:MAPEG family protein [Sphingopyxis panaciterrae]|uniref:MAPEG family protein n=1 Tax=Sphingopyxis panaciterrae TaxID=363841 RepID=UPI001421B0DA|nr:MAPEG family protein [Sphingopyxis panaciterrae]